MIDPNATGRRLGTYKSAAKKCGVTVADWISKQLNGECWCYRCKAWHPRDKFAVDRSRPNGYASICRPCASLASTASRYGLSRDRLSELRSGSCAICGRAARMVIDHCHKTGKVRDALCQRCNSGIGAFKDNPALLRSAIEYLEKHNG